MATTSNTRYLLGTAEFEVLWADVLGADGLGAAEPEIGSGPGPPPAALRIGSAGRTHSARRDLVAASRQTLRDRGLAPRSGPDAGAARLLQLLAHPDHQLELRADGDPSVRAVAAGWGGEGALAVRRGDVVELSGCDSPSVALLDALPPARSGPGRAISLPTAALASAVASAWSASPAARPLVRLNGSSSGSAAGPLPGPRNVPSEESALVAALISHRMSESEARLIGRMLAPVRWQAQVVALRRDRNGELRRFGGVLRVLDGPQGRYLVTSTAGVDGVSWTSVAPADASRLRHHVSALLHATEPDQLLHAAAPDQLLHAVAPDQPPCGPEVTTRRRDPVRPLPRPLRPPR